MPTGTTFKPLSASEFTADKLNFAGHGVLASAAPGVATNIDLVMTDDCLAQGVQMLTSGSAFGDYVHMQVVDASGAFTGAPGTVLNQFGTNWYMRGDSQFQLNKDMLYPAKVLAGMTMRIVYVSTGLTPVQVAVNYSLHKVLI